MNSVERVHTALTGVQPDRVPLVEMLMAPKIAEATGAGRDYGSYDA